MNQIKLLPYQDEFIFSDKKFPCLCAGVGTGKTMCLLLKAWQHAEEFPGSTNLIVRNEFTDLRDSTVKDFKRYFSAEIDSNKEYKFPNGSVIMFRHGSELNTLKNMSLSFVGIEQAEEFVTDEQFTMLRDRLRHPKGRRQLAIICNAAGHNWIWNLWKHNPPSPEYHLITATSFDNPNLPEDFVADLKRMEREQPNHYAQYVLSSFEQMDDDDFVFNFEMLMQAKDRTFAPRAGYGHRIMGYDIARYGNDACAAVGLHQMGALAWDTYHVEEWRNTDLDYTTGRILSISTNQTVNDNIIDEDGIGSGPLDFITKGRGRDDFRGFRNTGYSFEDNKFYANQRTEAAFKARELVAKGFISIHDEPLIQELMTLRFRYTNDGRRILVSKEEMRKKGYRSPNRADAFLMACSLVGEVREQQDIRYINNRQLYSNSMVTDNMFELAGVR